MFTTTSTTTARPSPMTTPFTIPSSCTGNFKLTTTLTTSPAYYGDKSVYLVDVGPDGDACNHGQAPNVTGLDLALRFSPGVCPSAWTAYNLQIDRGGGGKSQKSSAWCCPSGFEPGHVGLPSTAGACTRSQSSNTSTSQDDSYNRQRRATTTTLLLETAWLVTWAKSDTKTMSPRPPGLGARCTEAEIATWTPGAKVTDSDRHCREPEHDLAIFDSPTAWFLIVGLPVLFIVLPSVYCCCVRPSLKKRRKRRSQARRDAEARAANEVIPGMGEMDGRTDG